MFATITRLEFNPTETLGVLQVEGALLGFTLELPWRRNSVNISCIPTGLYRCKKYVSPTWGMTWEVPAEGRGSKIGLDPVIFHVGNRYQDTRGCILLGTYHGELEGIRAILDSRKAFKLFIAKTIDADDLILLIEEIERISAPRR